MASLFADSALWLTDSVTKGENDREWLLVVSAILGYCYCFLWSIASIPQLWSNFKRKSVAGYSLEFLSLHFIGFYFYSIYVWAGSAFQKKYDLTLSITIQDKIFAVCGTTVVTLLATQALVLYPHTRTGTFSQINIIFITLVLAFGFYNGLLGIGGFLPWYSKNESPYTYSVIHYAGYAKSFCSLVKYIPQFFLHIRRKSTYGYNINHALLDVVGGCASILQMFCKAFGHPHDDGSPDWHHVFGNAPKLILAIECVTFDIIFIFQHFVLYRENNAKFQKEEEQKALFGEDGGREHLLGDHSVDSEMTPPQSSDQSSYSWIQ